MLLYHSSPVDGMESSGVFVLLAEVHLAGCGYASRCSSIGWLPRVHKWVWCRWTHHCHVGMAGGMHMDKGCMWLFACMYILSIFIYQQRLVARFVFPSLWWLCMARVSTSACCLLYNIAISHPW